MRHEPMMQLIDNLANTKLAKSAGLDSWFLWNGGADAVEGAIKIARMATGKPNVITMNLGYHGRTFMTMALTASGTTYRSGFGPLPSGIFPAPFPYVTRSPLVPEHSKACANCNCAEKYRLVLTDDGAEDAAAAAAAASSSTGCQPWGCESQEVAAAEVERCLRELKLLLRTQTAPGETACIIIEPVLGEGGYVPPPPGYFEGVRAICDEHDILLIIDEVQTGFGRTGTMFASEWLNVKPDIIVSAKGLANGFPLSAVGTTEKIANHQPPGSMGGTYGGNAVACAAANAVFDVIESENVLENCVRRGDEARNQLAAMSSKYPGLIREVRGRGLMLGVEFNQSYFMENTFTYGQFAGAVAAKCWEKDLLVLTCGPYDVLRLIPPLTITETDLKSCLSVLEVALEEVVKEHSARVRL